MQFSADQLLKSTVYDQSGSKVGHVQQVYLNDATGEPSWVTVRTGFFGTNESLVPLDGAQINDDILKVPFDKQIIKDAPNYDPGHHLDGSDEADLYRHYGSTPTQSATTGTPEQERSDRPDQGYPRTAEQSSADHPSRAERIGGGEPLVQPETSRHEQGDSWTGEREQRGGSEQSGGGEPLVQPDRTGRHEQGETSAGGREQRGGPGASDREDSDRERDFIERERELLGQERDLLDRERQLAEQEGAVRPRLRRHNPGGHS
jgi:sporulation protein YlmC with PRC-barrel domain